MKIFKKLLIRRFQKLGYSSYFAPRVLEQSYQDLFHNPNTTLKEKLWAQRRGFLSDKIAFYGLNEENYRDYLSDFDYWRMHPINGEFSHWIDDKLTIRYLLQSFQPYLPQYFYHLGRSEVLRLVDCPDKLGQSIDSILLLLRDQKHLAVKLLSGSAGEGFYKLQFDNETFYINNKLVSEEELINQLSAWIRLRSSGVLVTEYLCPNRQLADIWPHTANTLRLTVIREKNQQPKIISALIRFGTSTTGIIDNALAGGVFSKVDILTGYFNHGKIYEHGYVKDCPYHPDSNAKIEGYIPDWVFITEKTLEICQYISQVVCMGIDLIITDDGFKLIEINSHPNIEFIQYDIPAFKNDRCSDFYRNHLKRIH